MYYDFSNHIGFNPKRAIAAGIKCAASTDALIGLQCEDAWCSGGRWFTAHRAPEDDAALMLYFRVPAPPPAKHFSGWTAIAINPVAFDLEQPRPDCCVITIDSGRWTVSLDAIKRHAWDLIAGGGKTRRDMARTLKVLCGDA